MKMLVSTSILFKLGSVDISEDHKNMTFFLGNLFFIGSSETNFDLITSKNNF